MKRQRVLVGVAASVCLAVAGCGPTGSAATKPRGAFNQADADFVPAMNQLISQSTTLAEAAEQRAADPAVRRLATEMKTVQYPQLDTLIRLGDGIAKQPELHVVHDHGDSGSSIPGYLPEDDVDRMITLAGKRFDRAFLTLVIRHHDGAITVARTERAEGRSPEAKDLAAQLETTLGQQNSRARQLGAR